MPTTSLCEIQKQRPVVERNITQSPVTCWFLGQHPYYLGPLKSSWITKEKQSGTLA